uniref:NADH-ubiquinone oxidoreductase chain 6 n=1 Tax=Abrus expansivus TaxID=2664682 RepID=A0A5Q0S2C1_9HEMI|nr:NADH dehydrogenase subunit 6 [Abrus expansivus]QGA47527.1 NADH dehydrogenase subunit 6 [Abrus expansivus]
MLIMKMMVMISSLIFMIKTPMSLGILLLIQTSLSTILVAKIMDSSWMALIIFLMLIGGLMILFMYMSSISSNEKFSPKIMMAMLLLMVLNPMEELYSESQINDLMKFNMSMDTISLTKIYNKKTIMITIMMFMYMLLAMIVVTKIVKIYKGPLRSRNF